MLKTLVIHAASNIKRTVIYKSYDGQCDNSVNNINRLKQALGQRLQ